MSAVAVTLLVTGCPQGSANSQQVTGNPAAAEFASAIHNKVTTDAMMGHLSKRQDIAKANNGTCAVGTPGYEASVDYVVTTLRASGFDVQTPEFSARVFHGDTPTVTVGGVAYAVALSAQDLGGHNGVRVIADRTRHTLAKK